MPTLDCCKSSSIKIGESSQNGPYFRCRQCGSYWHQQPSRAMFSEEDGAELVPVYNGKRELGLDNITLLGAEVDWKLLINEIV